MTYRQANPFCIQIEPTEGCNLRCGFCGIRGIREKGTPGDLSGPYLFMSIDTATSIGQQMQRAGWTSRIEIAMHGEPTMHPALPLLVSTLRSYLPRNSILVTTNGIPMLEGRAEWGTADLRTSLLALINAGANTIAIDDYRPHRVAPKVREMEFPFPVMEYPADKNANPHTRRPEVSRIVLVEDISEATTGNHSHLTNHCGAAAPKDRRHNAKVCTLPFREMAVRYDGSIAMCCNDWRGEFRMGHADDLVATWHSDAAYAARRVLLSEGRDHLAPCDGCNYLGMRPGLLPNPGGEGRAELGLPTQKDRDAITAAQAHGTLSPVVLRRWERGDDPSTAPQPILTSSSG